MNFIDRRFLSGAAVLLALSSVSAHAATIVNGSFEEGRDAPTGTFKTLGSGNTDIEGWKVVSGSIDWINSYWSASLGQRSVDLSGNEAGAIEQTLTELTPGQTYRVSFDMAGNIDGGDAWKDLIAAVIDDRAFTFNVTGTSKLLMGWLANSFNFTASSSTHTLRFESKELNAYGAALDNVALAAVPLPAALPLFATALGGMGLAGWLRRRKAAAAA